MSKDLLYSNKGGGSGTGEVQLASALDFQQDGDHYKTLKMQPIELAYKVNGSPCFTKLAKYASRHKIDRLGDLKKAIHCIQLEKELGNPYEYIQIPDRDFYDILTQFTDSALLWLALDEMYHGRYDNAVKYIQYILEQESPNET